MSISLLTNSDGHAAMYCNTTMVAFGPVFEGTPGGPDGEDEASAFLDWAAAKGIKPRQIPEHELTDAIAAFMKAPWCQMCLDCGEISVVLHDGTVCVGCAEGAE